MSETADGNATLVNAGVVRALARVADLPLAEDRLDGVAAQLDGLLREANAVNRFMAKRRDVGPGIRYHHPEAEESPR
jgi:hypothetical protein